MPHQIPPDRDNCLRQLRELSREERTAFLRRIAAVNLELAFELSVSPQLLSSSSCAGAEATQADKRRHFIDGKELVFSGAAIVGGMGQVRRAQLGDAIVAVKSLPPSVRHMPELVERFHREYDTLRRLFHRNIVPFCSVDPNGEFFVMQFIEGLNAQDWRKERGCTPQAAAEVVLQVAEAVSYAHDHGVIHRDIKPRNIVIDDAAELVRPVLIDFGIASCDQFDMGLTGGPIGTRWYMSPKQFSALGASQADASDDVYGLGGLLYFLICGASPYEGANAAMCQEELKAIVTDPRRVPESFRQRGVTCPAELETICLKCLQTLPNQRYHSAAEVAEDLGRFLRGDTINAAPETFAKKSARVLQRHRVPLAIAAMFAFFACSLFVMWSKSTRAERRYQSATTSLVDVLDFLSGTLRREELLRSPDVAAFRYALLDAYEQHHQLALQENASRSQLEKYLASVLSIAKLAKESGTLDIAQRLTNSAVEINQRLGGEESQFHLSVQASQVALARDREEYRQAIQLGQSALEAVAGNQNSTTNAQRLRGQITLDVAWCHFYLAELPAAIVAAERSRHFQSQVFEQTDSHMDRVLLADAINCAGYMVHKGALLQDPSLTIAGVAEPTTPNIVALGLDLLNDASHQCRGLSVTRAELNNTLGLSLVCLGQYDEAARTHAENIAIYEQLCQTWPLVVQYQAGLAKSQGNMADVLHEWRRGSRSLDFRFAAVESYRRVLETCGPQRDFQNDYSVHAVRLHAALLSDPEREHQALAVARRAIAVAPDIERAEPRSAIQQINAGILLAHLAGNDKDSIAAERLLARCRECLDRAQAVSKTPAVLQIPASPVADSLTGILRQP